MAVHFPRSSCSRCAVVDLKTGAVTNIILADPEADKAHPGTRLIAIEDDHPAGVGWHWSDAVKDFVDRRPESATRTIEQQGGKPALI